MLDLCETCPINGGKTREIGRKENNSLSPKEDNWIIRNIMSVILTEEQKKSPLYKYYEMDIESVEPELFAEVMAMSYKDRTDGTPIQEINRLFDEGYEPMERGMSTLPDGGVMFANLTDMPGVTPEMFDWWFAWHGLDPMRYIIWDKDDHYSVKTLNREQNLNSRLTMKERYYETKHIATEALLDGQEPVDVHLEFVNPVKVGFDPEKLKNFKGSILATPGPAVMVHFVRPTATGCELRTRFWMGYVPSENGMVKVGGFPEIDMMGRSLLLHNIKEFRHLAKILPLVYEEFKDDFLVGIK